MPLLLLASLTSRLPGESCQYPIVALGILAAGKVVWAVASDRVGFTTRLILGGSCHLTYYRQVNQEGFNFGVTFSAGTLVMEQDKAANSVDIGLFGTNALMLEADFLTYLIKQLGFDIHNFSQSYFAYRFFKKRAASWKQHGSKNHQGVDANARRVSAVVIAQQLNLINRLIESCRIRCQIRRKIRRHL